jgi:Negative regulator of sigma F
MNAPPPSAKLLDAVASMQPVRTRSPLRTVAVVVALWSVYGAIPLVAFRLRPDLPFLPRWWVIVVALAWWAGFMGPLVLALLPRRRQVLPDGDRALAAALAAAVALISLGVLFTRDAPGHSLSFPLHLGMRNCLTFAVIASILPVTIGFVASRRVVTVGTWRIGAAFGAASGALAGLILHLLCPVGGAAHAALAHGGALVVCGLLGALIAPRVLEG